VTISEFTPSVGLKRLWLLSGVVVFLLGYGASWDNPLPDSFKQLYLFFIRSIWWSIETVFRHETNVLSEQSPVFDQILIDGVIGLSITIAYLFLSALMYLGVNWVLLGFRKNR
jgi:hypothetical protein